MVFQHNIIYDFVSLYKSIASFKYELDIESDSDYYQFLVKEFGVIGSPYLLGGLPKILEGSLSAIIIKGAWCVVCSECQRVQIVRKDSKLWLCINCSVNVNIQGFRQVNWRKDCVIVEAILLQRPQLCNRNALYEETLTMLLDENEVNL